MIKRLYKHWATYDELGVIPSIFFRGAVLSLPLMTVFFDEYVRVLKWLGALWA